MVLDTQGLFKGGQEITFRYEEQLGRPNIASKEAVFWHVPAGSTGENQLSWNATQLSNSALDWTGQTFTVGFNGPYADVTFTSMTWALSNPLGSPGDITCEVTTCDASGDPTTVILATGTTDGNTLTGSLAARKITFDTPVQLKAGQLYACYVYAAGADASNTFGVGWQSGSSSYGASAWGTGYLIVSTNGGTSWTQLAQDAAFICEVSADSFIVNLFGTIKQIPVLDVN